MPVLLRAKLTLMKKILFVAVLLLGAATLFAQTSGTVYYHEKAALHFNIQGDAPPPPNLPTERNNYSVLYYTPDASLYVNDPGKEQEPAMVERESTDGEESVHVKMAAPDNRFYSDFKNGQCTDQRDFMQRTFLVSRQLRSADWKLTGNQKMVLNFPCQEATRMDDDKKITAWFTASIPVPAGPAAFAGLPGLVLEVSINNGDQVITATAVEPGDANTALIRQPKDGKKVTEAEFKKIRDEKMKELGMDNGGNNVIIRINNH